MKIPAFLFSLTLFLCLTGNASAARVAEIELNDGSIVRGEIVSAGNGVFKVQSETLGAVTIEESKIRNIRVDGSGRPATGERNATAAVPGGTPREGTKSGGAIPDEMLDSVRQRIQGDPEVMGMIGSLQDDPDFQEVLKDPAVMAAVYSGDVSALLANPKFMKILNSHAVQEIEKKLAP